MCSQTRWEFIYLLQKNSTRGRRYASFLMYIQGDLFIEVLNNILVTPPQLKYAHFKESSFLKT